ncbi:MAG TPA: universal stress protein UspA [Lactobacillus sp.]|nr:universal stress protein UspA [Lactobacillus sp.]
MSEDVDKVFKRILVGVDDSADAQLAFKYAVRRAAKDDATLIITSILESDDMNVYQALTKDYVHGEHDELVEHLKQYQKVAEEGGVKNVEFIIDEGDPGETIVKNVISEANADLLIIGSLSKKGIRKYFGSQAAYMAKYSPISVMIIR